MTPLLDDLIGTPYKVQGRDELGVDCFGLIWIIAFRNGTPIPDPFYKGFDSSLAELAEGMNVKKVENLSPGCVIEMEKDGRLHLGYALDDKRMIHATRTYGVMVEEIRKYKVKGYYVFT